VFACWPLEPSCRPHRGKRGARLGKRIRDTKALRSRSSRAARRRAHGRGRGPTHGSARAGWSTRFPDDGEVTDAMGVYLQHALPALAGLERSPLNLAAAALQVSGA